MKEEKNNFKLIEPELQAEIYYLTQQEGGRKTAISNGYRGQFYYDGQNWNAPQEFINKEICHPGDTIQVYLQTVSPKNHIRKFLIGQAFEIREGDTIVGKGKITKILKIDFKK